MPNEFNVQTQYVSAGNPDNENASSIYAGGQLGQVLEYVSKSYQYVQADSGATSATPAGAIAANDLAYWSDRANYKVTNDSRFALLDGQANSFRNNVAGVFRTAVTGGNYCFVLQRGRNINVAEAGSATGGMILIASTSTTASDALGVAINTAPNCISLGVVVTATANSVCVADVDIPSIP